MSAMIVGPYTVSTGVAGIVLVVVLLIGVAAGRAKRRLTLLVAGLAVGLVLGIAVVAVSGGPAGDDPAVEITELYTVIVPLGVAYAAGWLSGRGSWLRRLVVLGAAALLLGVFPYAAAGRATADSLLQAPAEQPDGAKPR
jgi:peptidoglycan/LPS O-acetylase OafA/YrhL